ncbi:hypothetical protein RQP46_004748 [Phenoliferia psychrophenolica]
MSKHIINEPKQVVTDALVGLTLSNAATSLDPTTNTLYLRDFKKENVLIMCGGGSGHEPAHAAFVGDGMLSCAVSGQVFASPNSKQIEKALVKLSSAKGTLMVVKCYTGDVLQFGLARERWSASHTDDSVRMVIVGDDVAVPRSQGVLTGRRGLAGTVLVYKVAGALAASGASLDEVEHLAQIVASRTGTIGVGLDHCHVPGTAASESYLGADEVEIGMGIVSDELSSRSGTINTDFDLQHNEPGVRKVSPIPTASKLVDELVTTITDANDKERGFLDFKHEVILLVNNLGGLPELELAIVVKEACLNLASKRIKVERVISGSFVSSLSLPGFSISLVLLPREAVPTPIAFTSKLSFDKELILYTLDAPTEAPGWRWHYKGRPESHLEDKDEKVKAATSDVIKGPAPTDPKLFLSCLELALKRVVAAEPEITRFDTIAGDGDAGLTLKAGAEGVQAKLELDQISSEDVVAATLQIAEVVDVEMGGTSGGLYSIFFSGLSKGLLQAASERQADTATAEVWARGLELALNTLYVYTRARPPSRTLVDPLAAFILNFAAFPEKLDKAFAAGILAADTTRFLDATAGRAAYIDAEKIHLANVPDAGAAGVSQILEGIRDALAGHTSS